MDQDSTNPLAQPDSSNLYAHIGAGDCLAAGKEKTEPRTLMAEMLAIVNRVTWWDMRQLKEYCERFLQTK